MGGSKAVKVAEVVKSEGQVLVERIEKFLGEYMCLPDDFGLVGALWVLMTWCFDKFDIIPYLVITASTKGAGKTTFSELLARLSFNPVQWGSATPATMYRMLGEKDGKMSLFIDEAEGMAKEAASALRSVLNIGFRRGGTVARTGSGGKVETYPAFCPKVIILIGDVFDTLRDRSIRLSLHRGSPVQLSHLKDYDMSVVDGEAGAIVGDPYNPATGTVRHVMASTPAVMAVRPAFLSGRDRDIWAALFGLAAALKLDDATVDRLTRVAAELSKEKSEPARKSSKVSEAAATEAANSEQLLRDLRRVLKAGETKIFSADAVTRLRALNDGGWSKYRGVGLDVMSLASLLERHGVRRKSMRLARASKGVEAPKANGYEVAAIELAYSKLGGEAV